MRKIAMSLLQAFILGCCVLPCLAQQASSLRQITTMIPTQVARWLVLEPQNVVVEWLLPNKEFVNAKANLP